MTKLFKQLEPGEPFVAVDVARDADEAAPILCRTLARHGGNERILEWRYDPSGYAWRWVPADCDVTLREDNLVVPVQAPLPSPEEIRATEDAT